MVKTGSRKNRGREMRGRSRENSSKGFSLFVRHVAPVNYLGVFGSVAKF